MVYTTEESIQTSLLSIQIDKYENKSKLKTASQFYYVNLVPGGGGGLNTHFMPFGELGKPCKSMTSYIVYIIYFLHDEMSR